MIRNLVLAVAFVTISSCEIQAQAVVCPPHLSYCYEKPILKQQRFEDFEAEIMASARGFNDSLDRRLRSSDRGLYWELRRSRYCNSVSC